MENDIEARIRSLVDAMTASGQLRSPEWRSAFLAVPRHEFVPRFWSYGSRVVELVDTSERERWLDGVYTNQALVTDQVDGVPASSSTQPGLMATMLESAEIRDGDRVLEVGAGTGYNAALLSHRVGAANVTTVDIDEAVAASATTALARCGCAATVLVADGLDGYRPRAPYDRVIATCSVRRIPPAWPAQVAPGGTIIASLGLGVVALTVDSAHACAGRFLPRPAGFIDARRNGTPTHRFGPADIASHGQDDAESIGLCAPIDGIDDIGFDLFSGLTLPTVVAYRLFGNNGVQQYGYMDIDTRSRCLATPTDGGDWEVSGSAPLWQRLHAVDETWRRWGRPQPRDLTLAVAPDGSHTLGHASSDLTLPL